jgi:hypothetical protein
MFTGFFNAVFNWFGCAFNGLFSGLISALDTLIPDFFANAGDFIISIFSTLFTVDSATFVSDFNNFSDYITVTVGYPLQAIENVKAQLNGMGDSQTSIDMEIMGGTVSILKYSVMGDLIVFFRNIMSGIIYFLTILFLFKNAGRIFRQ